MKKDFIKDLEKLGFYPTLSNNLTDNNIYYYDQYKIQINDNGWLLYFEKKGIGNEKSFDIKDLFKLITERC